MKRMEDNNQLFTVKHRAGRKLKHRENKTRPESVSLASFSPFIYTPSVIAADMTGIGKKLKVLRKKFKQVSRAMVMTLLIS